MENDELYNRIVESYKKTHSVDKTAAELKTSRIKVRRVLITENLWSSDLSRKIAELRKEGKSVKEIAEKLHYSVKNIEAFSPYKRGSYGGGKQSIYAARSKEYRQRMQVAAENQAGSSANAPKGYIRIADIENEVGTFAFQNRPIAIKIRIELDMSGCSEQQIDYLREYGKMEKSLSREVIVPSDITLHAMHYVIQQLFGWQNSYPHHFAFPSDVFKRVTQDSFARWCSLAGVYFRFPDSDTADLYWDEDYQADKSIKSWLRSKYTCPYKYGGLGDYYLENQRKICTFKQEHPFVKVENNNGDVQSSFSAKLGRVVAIDKATMDEIRSSRVLAGSPTHLLERLTLLEYLKIPNNDYFIEPLDEKVQFLEDSIGTSLMMWDSVLEDIDNKHLLFDQIAAFSTVRMQGQSDSIHYFYDDVWRARISILDTYYKKDLNGDEQELLMKMVKTSAPVCVAADGLSVLDDVRGVPNFADFLCVINEDIADFRRDYRELAKSLGWTGRKVKPQNML